MGVTIPTHPAGCRCGACRDASRLYERRRSRLKAYGQWQPFVDAAPVRAHVEALIAAGMSGHQIAAAAGLHHGTVYLLLRGEPSRGVPPPRRTRPSAAEALLAVTPAPPVCRVPLVDACGARRRAQALMVGGWCARAQAADAGVSDVHLLRVINCRHGTVTATFAAKVAAMYDRLWDQPPPTGTSRERVAATRARRKATQMGWAPPLAYDDGELDDPDGRPHEWKRPGRRSRPRADLVEDARELAAQGLSRKLAAERLGVSGDALAKAFERARRETAA